MNVSIVDKKACIQIQFLPSYTHMYIYIYIYSNKSVQIEMGSTSHFWGSRSHFFHRTNKHMTIWKRGLYPDPFFFLPSYTYTYMYIYIRTKSCILMTFVLPYTCICENFKNGMHLHPISSILHVYVNIKKEMHVFKTCLCIHIYFNGKSVYLNVFLIFYTYTCRIFRNIIQMHTKIFLTFYMYMQIF